MISYTLPFESDVKLIVYNSIGEKVKVMVNAIQRRGYYKVTFDTKTLPDGIYFITIKAISTKSSQKFINTKKIILALDKKETNGIKIFPEKEDKTIGIEK